MISLRCGIKKTDKKKLTYLKDRNRLTDIENKFMVTKGGREGNRIRI